MSENKLDVKNYALYMVQRFLTKVVFQYVMHAMQILMVKSIFPNHLRMSSSTNIVFFSFCYSYPTISSLLYVISIHSLIYQNPYNYQPKQFTWLLTREDNVDPCNPSQRRMLPHHFFYTRLSIYLVKEEISVSELNISSLKYIFLI